jgi:hypothetical protein
MSLLGSKFWTRAWIIQELVVARDVTIFYGRKEIPFDLLGQVSMAFKTIEPGTNATILVVRDWLDLMKPFKRGVDFVARFHDFRMRYRLNRMYSLPDIILECAQSEASRNHDKVWALLGISGDLAVPGLEPDYKVPEKELYKNVAKHVLLHGGDSRYTLFGIAGSNIPNDPEDSVSTVTSIPQNSVLEESPTQERTWPSWVPHLARHSRLYPHGNAACPYRSGMFLESEINSQLRKN